MDAVRDLLGRQAPDDRAAMFAAAVVDQTNQTLVEDLELDATLAQATIYKDGVVTIDTFHGAVLGRLADQQSALLEKIQARIKKIFPHHTLPIQRLRLRAR